MDMGVVASAFWRYVPVTLPIGEGVAGREPTTTPKRGSGPLTPTMKAVKHDPA
jgi:hypothetical protein